MSAVSIISERRGKAASSVGAWSAAGRERL